MRCLLLYLLLLCSGLQLTAQDFPPADPSLIALYPQQNATRNTLKLSGVWKWKKDSLGVGEAQNWEDGLTDYRSIAVPGSWNDQFTDSHNYLGLAWYETETWLPASWSDEHVFLRIGSANYAAKVWVNGQPIGSHEGGHLPFAFDLTPHLRSAAPNRITVQVENILKPSRVPTGNVEDSPFNNFPRSNFDFFPFAGLQRDVWLYTVPVAASIRDITVSPSFTGTTGELRVEVVTEGSPATGTVTVTGPGGEYTGSLDFRGNEASTTITLPDVRLWTLVDPYLYTVEVRIGDEASPTDHYRLETGVRTVGVSDEAVLLNGEPVFLKGFGKHEDFPIFGKGTALPVMIKDFALLDWVGANSFRTSHYPYDEAYLRMADREGFLIIDETPAVGLFFHGDSLELAQRQAQTLRYIDEMIIRDKNHPSVIMWCVANEPFPPNMSGGPRGRKAPAGSTALFEEMYDRVKQHDTTRPATMVGVMGGPAEWLAPWDVVSINRYYGWYTHLGDPVGGATLLGRELDGLYKRFGKPIIVTEFGADAYPGNRNLQSEMFSENFQTDFLRRYLDIADDRPWVTGMHVWAFADFRTSQGLIRFNGMNYKGVFTQDRKPKAAAFFLRDRWANK